VQAFPEELMATIKRVTMLGGLALASLLGAALVSGCSGGGSTSKPTPSLAGTGTSGTLVPVAITFTIPGSATTTSSTTRKPEFVSSGINSAVASALQLKSGTWTPVAAQVYDLSPTSPNCSSGTMASTRKPERTAGRTCTIYLPAPVGNDQFELDTYNGIVGAGSNCTTTATVTSSCSLGSELSSGMDLGPSGAGYAVASGTSTSVTISLQAIVASIVPGGLYNASISTATGTSASGPSFANPAFVVGAQTNNSTQEVNVCWSDNNGIAFPSESCTGAQNEDASGVTIQQSTSTCSQLQNDFATAFQLAPATVGGNVNDLTKGVATIQFESCANASAGNNVFVNVALGAGAPQSNPNYEVVDKPAADIFWNYTGGGGAGDESTTAPFWAAATSTTTGFPSGATVPVGITSPTQAATSPQVMTGATSAAKPVTYILAPLYAVVQDAASLGGTQRESAGTNNVTLNLAGPDGYTAKLYAAQAAVPSNQSATGYQVLQPGSCAGVFTLGTRTTGKWGAMWPINGGGTAASGTTCQVLVYDNDQPTNHYVVVTITNTAAGGGVSFVPPGTSEYAYVVNGDDATISAYQINTSSGALTPVPGQPFAAGNPANNDSPFQIAVDPAGKFVYVTNQGNNNVFGYAINASNGALTPVPGSPFPAGNLPIGVAVSPNDKFAYVINGNDSAVAAYAINASTGALTPAGSPFSTGPGSNPNYVALDPTGKFAYVDGYSNDTIPAFTINASTGSLTPVLGSPFLESCPSHGNCAPAAVAVDPTGKFVYLPNFLDNSVSAYTINASSGALTTVAGSPFASGHGPEFEGIDPTGKFVYVSNAYDSNVYGYSINSSSGALTTLSGSPFPINAEFMAFEPTGKFVYMVTRPTVSGYSINASSGGLTPAGTAATGGGPSGIAIATVHN
jgi:6-phosphogluconolactonase (cycloisomerase 2 family)